MNKALMAAALAATALTATNANAATTVDFTINTEFSGLNVPGSPATITGQFDYDSLLAAALTPVSGFTVLINGSPFTDFPAGVNVQYFSATNVLDFSTGLMTAFSFNLSNVLTTNGGPPASATTSTNATAFTYSTATPVTVDPGLAGTLAVVESATAAPEPATWLLMLVGFGAVGYGLRRRKAAASKVSYSFA